MGLVGGEDLNMFHLRGRENSGQAEGLRCKRGQWENGGWVDGGFKLDTFKVDPAKLAWQT